jgi:thiol-disulfide isomerase/thioredoxin
MSEKYAKLMSNPSTITSIKSREQANKFITDASRDSCIILYYWNSCGHCNTFKPIWEQLKQRFENRKKIYEIEFEQMEKLFPQSFKITSYPTIVSYNNSEKQIFNNSRTFENVSDFINSTVKTLSRPKTAPVKIERTPTKPLLLPPKPNAKPKPKAKSLPTPKATRNRQT